MNRIIHERLYNTEGMNDKGANTLRQYDLLTQECTDTLEAEANNIAPISIKPTDTVEL